MLHILHAADLHLDAPFAALTADQARQRRAEQRLLLEKLADTASERGADLVLLSGDLLDDRQTYRETAQALAAALGRIPAPVLIAPGNHDFYQASSLYSAPIWPENVRIFREGAVRSVELPGCTVYGCAFTGPARDDSPLAGFRAPDTGKPGIMVLHADVEGTGRYASISREEIGPWATSTPAPAFKGRETPTGPTPAVPRAGALTNRETRGPSGSRWTAPPSQRSFSPCAPGAMRS